MCNTGFVKVMDAFANFDEHVSDEGIFLILALVQELKEFYTFQELHNKEADLFVDSLGVCPNSGLLEI